MPRKSNKSNSAAGEMQQLIQLLKKVALTKSGSSQPKRRRRARKARTKPAASQEGQIVLTRTELLGTVSIKKTKDTAMGHFDLVPDSFTFLKGISKSFERVRWDKLHIFYKPAVGTTYGGLVSVGVDWDFAQTDVERSKISGFTPNQTCAAWADTESKPMVLPQSRLQSRLWYLPNGSADWPDKGPGKLHWAATGTTSDKADTTVGEFWASYRVTMQGTNPA